MSSSPTSLQFPAAPPFPTASKPTLPHISLRFKPPRVSRHSTISPKLPKSFTRSTKALIFVSKAIEENRESAESETTIAQESPESNAELTELGVEIKKAMKERGGGEEGGLWSGVAEEIREIEWPAFGKVLGTTGVVLGVIAGSSVVLLTVNAVLAELSDRVFAGKGVQDFFG